MNREGTLLSARVAVLAAEFADADRYRRGRAAARSGAVSGTAVVDGVLSAEVLGSRPEPYAVELRVRAKGSARRGPVPARGDVAVWCTCPDDAPVCKHAVAVLLSFAEMVAESPQLLVDWTGIPLDARGSADVEEPSGHDDDEMPEFFGVRTGENAVEPMLAPLTGFEASAGGGELTDLALDALHHAHRALRALYG